MSQTLFPVEAMPWVFARAVLAVFVILAVFRSFWDVARPASRRESDLPIGIDYSVIELPRDFADRTDQAFDQMVAESGMGLTRATALGWMALAGTLVGGPLFVWSGDPLIGILGFVAGVMISLGVLTIAQNRYRKQIQDQLPEAFFLMARSLRAGLSLEQSIELSGKQGVEPLAKEFRRCSEHIRLGLPVGEALRLTSSRLGACSTSRSSPRSPFSTARSAATWPHLWIGSRPRPATATSSVARSCATTALGRISGLFVACAAPTIFIAYGIWQPEYVRVFFTVPGGMTALAIAATLEVVGLIWLLRLFRVEQ